MSYSRKEAEELSRALEAVSEEDLDLLWHKDSLKLAFARPEVKERRSLGVKKRQSHVSKASLARPEVKEKLKDSLKLAFARPEVKENRSRASTDMWKNDEYKDKILASLARPEVKEKRRKPCTIDGETFFPSNTELKRALGQGPNGSRSPNFRYVSHEEYEAYLKGKK